MYFGDKVILEEPIERWMFSNVEAAMIAFVVWS